MKTIQLAGSSSPAKSWLRALELTTPIPNNPKRILANVIDQYAEKFGDAPALLSSRESLTYRGLAERSHRYARWALDHGLGKGDVVCLMMPNRPEYMAIWLGITRIGSIVALLNTNLAGPSLAHCVRVAAPKRIIVASELLDPLTRALGGLADDWELWVYNEDDLEKYSSAPLSDAERGFVSIHDTALYIYTSGTTGLPKAAKISHFRVMQWSHWFAGLMEVTPDDRMYNCLPMYHSGGGVVATGAALAGGGSVVIRESFSARKFWDDIVRWDCTLFQYIGDLCRYLNAAETSPLEAKHRIRIACGNGLRYDVWRQFKERFHMPRILEFYAATEGNFSLYNVEEKPGAIGRIPPFLAHCIPVALVRFDVQREVPMRDEHGRCVCCVADEVGEAIGRISEDGSHGARFEGYTSEEASEGKVLRNVFEKGDAWYRTGDLMRRDEKGFFYFVDRIGDTFRWKGENVATSEVSETICAFPGVRDANVYGVTIPGTEGRAGMAAVVADRDLNLSALRLHLADRLPPYACPLFFRICGDLQMTGTFKHIKNDLTRDGYDPDATSDAIYFNDPKRAGLVPLDNALYIRIQNGQIEL
jgi:fatty-acyl-CoA synthase